jgi:hypothetical protein
MACTNLNNPNSSEGPPGPRRSTNEYRRNKKKILSLAKEEGRLILRNVAIRLRRPHKRRGPPSLSSSKKKLMLRFFSSVRTGEEPRAKK